MRSPRFLLIAGVAILLSLLSTARPAMAVTFTTDTLIGCNDTTYDGEDVVVDGCVVTIDCAHTFNSLAIINAGVLTHSSGVAGFDLTITDDLTVDSGGSISANGKGYGERSGPGAGGSTVALYAGAGGGGYGGRGGVGNQGVSGGSPYGSVTEPVNMGSGGGRHTYHDQAGGAGGGALVLTVNGTLQVEGSVTANGADGSCCRGGGGSGGSIYVTASALAGQGTISANGGNGHTLGGGGGGGRIAIYYDADTFTGSMSACGGSGYQYGGGGIIFRKSSSQTWGDLLVTNCGNSGANSTLPTGTYTFDTVEVIDKGKLEIPTDVTLTMGPEVLTIAEEGEMRIAGQLIGGGGSGFTSAEVISGGDLRLMGDAQLACTDVRVSSQGTITVGDSAGFDADIVEVLDGGTFVLNTAATLPAMHVASGGVVTHWSGVAGFHLTITDDLTVDSGGSISANGKGYGERSGPGAGGSTVALY
ncbi:MAG: hypothetical protein ABIF77_19345, partial [bacterium]